ncbi:MAG: metallophosphoesterase [Proteobacteria bacterium]|nr:metallophosphoesterase [Pseudomonadota bacterium]
MRHQSIWICSLALVLSAYGCSDDSRVADQPDPQDVECTDESSCEPDEPDEPDEPCTGEECADPSCDICIAGEKKCNGDELVECRKNEENCLDWAVLEDCAASGASCRSDKLACASCETCDSGTKKCTDNGVAECTPDGNGCAEWTVDEICNSGEHCDENELKCVPGCTNVCEDGETKCGDTEILTCQMGESGCYEWVTSETCEFGKICTGETPQCDYACGDDCEPFSIVVLPDTQKYTQEKDKNGNKYNLKGIYKKQTEWIKNNQKKYNIRFVMHMGDVTDNNYKKQFVMAQDAHDVLANANIPYSISTGNHEYKKGDSSVKVPSHDRTLFSKYFNDSYIKNGRKGNKYKDTSWFHGFHYKDNMYATFEVGNLKFAVIALEYAPRKDVLCWADNLIQTELQDRYVIVTTHSYIGKGATEDYSAGYTNNNNIKYTDFGASGLDVFYELAARHSNVIMVACGHSPGARHRNRPGFNGNIVEEMLVDYQDEQQKKCKPSNDVGPDSGNGWLRVLTIDPKNTKTEDGNLVNNVSSQTISVLSDYNKAGKFYCKQYDSKVAEPNHTYQFAFDFSKPIHYQYSTDNNIAFSVRNINGTDTGNQYWPAVAVNRATGAFVAVWQDDQNKKSGDDDIAARIFCAGGCQDVKQFRVNTTTDGHQRNPDVAMDKEGNFVVVWDDNHGGNYEIKMRGYDAKGIERFAATTVNSVPTGDQYSPAIAMAPDGKFVVTWTDESENKNTPQIFMRGYNADGSELFSARNVMSSTEGKRTTSDVAMADDGSFVVTWTNDNQIVAKGFNADGSERLEHFVVSTSTAKTRTSPAIGMNATGNFFIAYVDESSGTKLIKARGFDNTGKQIYEDTQVSNNGEATANPVVCLADDNKVVFGWTATASNSTDIRRRVLNPDMTFVSEAKLVNQLAVGPQKSPALGCTAEGKQVFLFVDDNDQNGYTEIFGRGFNE